MARVVLVNPSIVYSTWNANMNQPSPDTLFIRLGLAYLSAALKEAGHSVELLDLRMLSGWEEFEERVKKMKPDFLGASVHSIEISIAKEAASRAKRVSPGLKTVAGGPHPCAYPEDLAGDGAFDYVLRGEGEVSLPKLVENPGAFDSVFWGETPDLDRIPHPDREIWTDYRARITRQPFNIEGYRFPLPMAEMINTRGCPYKCTFCFGPGERNMYTRVNKEGKRKPYIRGRSVENVIDELHKLQAQYGIRSVMFHDDHFLISKKWVERFCAALHDEGFVGSGFKWVTSAKADALCRYEPLIQTMADAGLELLIIGFESFSPRILKWFNKTATREENFEAAEICRRAGIKIWANYMLGIPTDTGWHPEDDLMTVEGVLRVKPIHYSPAYFTPIPGSLSYDFYRENNLLIGDQSAEAAGNRGAMAAKIAGVDYDFLDAIVVTDVDFAGRFEEAVSLDT